MMIILFLLIELSILIAVTLYLVAGLISALHKSPFVRSKNDVINDALKHPLIKKNKTFYDLGAGDGLVVDIASKKFNLRATGFEVNPLLVFYAKNMRRRNVIQKNIFEVDLRKVDIIYMYLFPELLEKLAPKLITQAKKHTIVISQTFAIPTLKPYLKDSKMTGKTTTFYYKM